MTGRGLLDMIWIVDVFKDQAVFALPGKEDIDFIDRRVSDYKFPEQRDIE